MPQVGFPRLYCLVGADARYDICTEFPSTVSRMVSAKASNPALIVLMHSQNGITYPVPNVTYASATFDIFGGATDNVIDGSAASAGVIRPFSAFWDKLYNANGSVAGISGGTSGHFGWNLANGPVATGIEDTWQALGRYMLYHMKQNRLFRDNWDGYRSDNWVFSIGAAWFYGSTLDHDRNGVVDAAGTLRGRWGDGLNALGQYLSQSLPGKTMGGNGIIKADSREGTWVSNHTDKDGWHRFPNFCEIEDGERYLFSDTMLQRAIDIVNSTDSSIDPVTGSSRLGFLNYPDFLGREKYVTFSFELKDDAGNFLATPSDFNNPVVYKQEIYYKPARKGLAAACIVGGYYYPLFFQRHDSRLFYDDEMLGGVGVATRNWMGQPLTQATTPVSGVKMREFEFGLAIVNVTGSALTATLPGGAGMWRKINGTAAHNEGGVLGATFTIPAHDGRLFVREGTAPAPVPINSVLPTISGTAQSGQALTPTRGTWLNSPTSFALTFARFSADGATRLATLQQQTADTVEALNTYTIVAADVGFTIRLEVTASNVNGSGFAISLATGVVGASAASDRFDGPPSAILDFTIASVSPPSVIFPASPILDFTIGGLSRLIIPRRKATPRSLTQGVRRVDEGGGGV